MSEIRKHIDLVESFNINEWDDDEEESNPDKELVQEEMGHLFPTLADIEDESFFTEAAHALRHECGLLIDDGMYRAVYHHRDHDDLVVKIEAGDDVPISNSRESSIWDIAEMDDKLSVWFAPVVSVSNNYWVIHQKKTGGWYAGDFPKRIPTFFKDADTDKFEQWGRLGDRIVCHDYGGMNSDEMNESWTLVKTIIDEDNEIIRFEGDGR